MSTSPQPTWQEMLTQTYDQLVHQTIAFTPKILGALLLLVVGCLVAVLLSKAARGGVLLLEKLVYRFFPKLISKSDLRLHQPFINAISKMVFWLVLLFFVAAGANSLGLELVSGWMSQLLLYLPRFAAGLLIMIGGYLLSNVIKMMMISTAESAGFRQAFLLGRSVQYAIIFTAVVIGVEQFGINIHFFTNFFIAISTVLTAGFSLAFALGARRLIANVIGAQQVNKYFQMGDDVTIAGVRGTLVEVGNTMVILETEKCKLTVPASYFLEHIGEINVLPSTE